DPYGRPRDRPSGKTFWFTVNPFDVILIMPTPDNTDGDLDVLPQERTVSNSSKSEVQHAKYIVNIAQGDSLHIGDKIGHEHAHPVPLSLEEQKEAVLQFLQAMEENFKYIKLFHTPQQTELKNQYIPIQVTLERRYKHEVEKTWSYKEIVEADNFSLCYT
ncbi:MAG: hypothetical protein PUP91_30200, partial [Rhizonema sp. PD37]|nr:hypothetical protein [Rhizonema sp. PD37]